MMTCSLLMEFVAGMTPLESLQPDALLSNLRLGIAKPKIHNIPFGPDDAGETVSIATLSTILDELGKFFFLPVKANLLLLRLISPSSISTYQRSLRERLASHKRSWEEISSTTAWKHAQP